MFFKSEEGKEYILSLYQQKLEELNIDYLEKTVNTQFGKTNIVVTGDKNLPPLLLIHGTGGCAPLILETFSKLSEKYCVYAVDVLSQPNKSAENRLNMKNLEYGKWLVEIINNLELNNVTLVGFSFGGMISLKALEYNEKNIKEVFLIAPVYIVNGNPLQGMLKMFIPLKQFIKTNNEEKIKKVMNALFSEYDDFALEFLSASFKHCNMDFSPLPLISKKSAKKLNTPITIFAAENDLMFPGRKMLKRSKNIFPSLKQVVLLENSKHVPNKNHFEKMQELMMEEIAEVF